MRCQSSTFTPSQQARDEVITVLKAEKIDMALLEAKYGFITPEKVLQALQRDAIQGKADVLQEDIYEKPMEEVTPAPSQEKSPLMAANRRDGCFFFFLFSSSTAAGQAGGEAAGDAPADAGAAADGGAGAQADALQAGGREEEPRRVHEEERRVHQPAGAGAREVSAS